MACMKAATASAGTDHIRNILLTELTQLTEVGSAKLHADPETAEGATAATMAMAAHLASRHPRAQARALPHIPPFRTTLFFA